MSVQGPTIASIPSPPSISPPLLHVRTDPYSGRKYHASSTLPENADLLGICAPFSYTIWKRFRREVCAECWRYDRGRRSFLTRRDDEGLAEDLRSDASGATQNLAEKGGRGASAGRAVGAGLWFCDASCQESWIAREGVHTVGLLRRLEEARQKVKAKAMGTSGQDGEGEITQQLADRVWDAVRVAETSPKEARKWQSILLDDYETDLARYVLLALVRCHRQQSDQYPTHRRSSPPHPHSPSSYQSIDAARLYTTDEERHEQHSEWNTFASLQSNELPLLRACPEILEHQTRIYQLLRGRFGESNVAVHPPILSSGKNLSASAPANISCSATDDGFRNPRGHQPEGDNAARATRPELGDVITVANVRTVLGVDPGNSFGIWEVPLIDESECLGFAVYPIASLFNHHCSPNVRKERDGRTLRFLTTCAVKEGQELCISYGHVEGMERSARQKELLEGWYFNCRCSRCRSEKPGTK